MAPTTRTAFVTALVGHSLKNGWVGEKAPGKTVTTDAKKSLATVLATLDAQEDINARNAAFWAKQKALEA